MNKALFPKIVKLLGVGSCGYLTFTIFQYFYSSIQEQSTMKSKSNNSKSKRNSSKSEETHTRKTNKTKNSIITWTTTVFIIWYCL